jgi:hypothetical protein
LYQEVYTKKMLPIITKDINSTVDIKKSFFNKEKNADEIHFKKDISDRCLIKALCIDEFDKTYHKPNQKDILKIIYLHNQKDYEESHKIDYKDFNIDIIDKPELVYIHSKLYIPINDINHIVITNGFTNDFESLFSKIYKDKHTELMQLFQKELKSDYDNKQRKQLVIPFTNNIKKYPKIIELIRSIEKDIKVLKSENSSSNDVKNSSRVIERFYDTFEELFLILSKGIKDNKILRNQKLLQNISESIGFKIYKETHIPILKVNISNNLQKYLAKCLINKKNELYEISSINPNFLYSLTKIFNVRNSIKHGDEKFDIEKIDIQDILKYKELLYKSIEIILKVSYQNIFFTEEEDETYDDIYINNAQIDLIEDLPIDTMNKLSQNLRDNLSSINFYLNYDNFNTNIYMSVTETCNQLSATFEQIIRNIINTLYLNDIKQIITKEEVLQKVKDKVEINDALSTVQEKSIENTIKKQSGSLGAYMLIYIYYNDDVTQKDVDLIQTILKLRKHGNPTMEDIQKIGFEELQIVRNNSLKYIIKLMAEI